ncbi:MAG: tetratricopeptide repeat protein [Kiritimatiellia bacterium]
MINVQDKLYEQAIPKLEWVIRTDPTLLEAWETLGWAYWLVGREKDAAILWQRLVEIVPNEPMGYNLLAQVMMRDGDLTRAEELYRTSLALDSEQYEIKVAMARIKLWTGRTREAVEALRRLLAEDVDRLDVELDLAWAMYANEEYEDALEVWNHINEVIPDQPDYIMARANVLLLIGATREAEADARRVLELDKSNRGAINLLASLAMRSRRPDEAIAALERVMELTPDDRPRARIALDMANYMKMTYDRDKTVFTMEECLKAARRAYDLDPENANVNLFYGELLTASRKYGSAEDIFQKVLDEMNPYNQRAHLGIMETYFARSMLDEAEKKLTENLRLFNPDNPFRHVYWARLHFARGDYPAAMEALDRLEYEGARGAIFVLLYHGLSPSEWSDMPSVRQFRDHLMILRRNGFKFITPSQFPAYFAQKQHPAAPGSEIRPALSRAVQGLKYAWTGRKPEMPPVLSDYTPERVVCITMDDALRNSLRYGAIVAEELQVPLTMFVPVAGVIDHGMYSATFAEMREYMESGLWEIQSHLWDAGYFATTNDAPDAQQVNPLPNLVWLPDKQRLESLREYHARLRHEFRDSKRVLARELGLEESEITAVAYPLGDIGQETSSNIELFNVPEVILNEAEISYRQGFVQDNFGYAVANDNPMLYKRHEPPRNATGREVLREALRQHPVFVARRMRAEIAALNGQLHLANRMLDILKRDDYPEEDLAELTAYVQEHLARLAKVPDIPIGDTDVKKKVWFEPRHPFLAVEGSSIKANEMLDQWSVGVSAGLNLNPRLTLEARASTGKIKQTVSTNRWVEVEKTTVSSSRSDVTIVQDGVTTRQQETRTTYDTVMVQSNVLVKNTYRADENVVGAGFRYIHENGAYTVIDVNNRMLEGDEIGDESALVFSAEHQWRPVPALDISARYQNDLVPSAREILRYDGFALRGIWRIRDWWRASGLASFAMYADDNSYLHAHVENLWRISQVYDIWFGLHDSVDTADRENQMYWTPYWDQRHYLILQLGRSYPNYSAMVRAHLGIQKDTARQEELERYNTARVRGEAEGWYPGNDPQQGWATLLGVSAGLSRTWSSGWNFTGEFTVNSIRDYTEHTLAGKLSYRF